jgi:hypothetical protein
VPFGAQIAVEDESCPDAAEMLRQVLPPQVVLEHAQVSPPADARFLLAASDPGAFEVRCGGDGVVRVGTAEELLAELRQRVELALAVSARSAVFVHAGVVGWRGVAILVPGPSHSGKSTLVAELVRAGADYYSDEYAVVDSDGLVHPYARPIALRPRSERIPRKPGGEPLAVGLIVATAYRKDAVWAPAILKGARGVLPILDNVVVVRDRPEIALRLAARLPPPIAPPGMRLSSPRRTSGSAGGRPWGRSGQPRPWSCRPS